VHTDKVARNNDILVSVVMPSFNEETYIRQAAESLTDDYFRENCELIVVDGKSVDRTREIVAGLQHAGIRLKLLENENRTQAFGLNLGIMEARGKYIVRADAHCIYPPGYVKSCVTLLEKTGAGNVGGMMLPKGKDDYQKAIALAFQHPLGVGDAKWHLGNFQGDVDTVYLGNYRRDLFKKIGLFDTNCRTNEDSELDLRILKAGKRVYLDSTIQVIYFPRETFRKLVKQYFFYGKGRAYTTFKHKKITSWRQLAPQCLVLGLPVSLILSLWQPLFVLFPALYVGAVFSISLLSWRKSREITEKQRLLMAAACILMHVSWGVGFLAHALSRLLLRRIPAINRESDE
jgi:succinoglycan biosynthesis protein ExoA